jgi:hypothetical protein
VVFTALLAVYPLFFTISLLKTLWHDMYWLIPILEGESFWSTVIRSIDIRIKELQDLQWKINKFFGEKK